MIRTMAKLFAYKKAPAQTFALLHPVKALKWGAIFLIVSRVMRRKQQA